MVRLPLRFSDSGSTRTRKTIGNGQTPTMIIENNGLQTNGPRVKLGPFVFADKDLLGQSHAPP